MEKEIKISSVNQDNPGDWLSACSQRVGEILDIDDVKEFHAAIREFLAEYPQLEDLKDDTPEAAMINKMVRYFKDVISDPDRDERIIRKMCEYVKNNPGTPVWTKKN